MSNRKRASGLVRGLVLQALREAVAARGPLCFTSRRAAAKSIAADLGDVSEATIRRALAHPDNDDLATMIQTAIQPRAPFSVDADQGAAAAEIGGDPVGDPGSDPVGDPGEPAATPSPAPGASPQVTAGDPVSEPDRSSRAREPRSSTSDPTYPDRSALAPPLPSTLGYRPRRIVPSFFDGECFICRCYLEEGQALMLVRFDPRVGARLFCIDHAELGLELAQLEWDLAHPRRQQTLFSPHTHQHEE